MSKLNAKVDFLGVDIWKTEDGRFASSQSTFIRTILAKYDHLIDKTCPNPLTPLPVVPNLDVEPFYSKFSPNFAFSEILGMISYLRLTRLDLLFALHSLSKVAHNPGDNGIKAILRTLCYLYHTQDLTRFFYPGDNPLGKLRICAFTDAEWASNRLSRKSVSGNFIYLGRSLV